MAWRPLTTCPMWLSSCMYATAWKELLTVEIKRSVNKYNVIRSSRWFELKKRSTGMRLSIAQIFSRGSCFIRFFRKTPLSISLSLAHISYKGDINVRCFPINNHWVSSSEDPPDRLPCLGHPYARCAAVRRVCAGGRFGGSTKWRRASSVSLVGTWRDAGPEAADNVFRSSAIRVSRM